MTTRDDGPSIKDPNSYNHAHLPSEGGGRPLDDEDSGLEPRYERWKKSDLYQRAKEMGIAGRSQMTKAELIATLRSRLLPH